MTKIKIEQLSHREHILLRPSMYIGGVSPDTQETFVFTGKALEVQSLTYSPGLVKIINEVIDNSIDIILKSNKGSKVNVDIDDTKVEVSDNSIGFPERQDGQEFPVIVALGNAMAGSNFNDDENIGQMGTNGVGAFATNCFSKLFEVVTVNGTSKVHVIWENNGNIKSTNHSTETKHLKTTGTKVKFIPDLKRFGVSNISNDVIKAIETRLRCLGYIYPKIKFSLNGQELDRPKNITDWLEVNDDPYVAHKADNYEVYVIARSKTLPNFSFVNGLNVKDGGSHLDVISNDISKAFSTLRGFQDISKSDVSNTLQLVFVGTGFKNLRFNSQTKEKITNSASEVRQYLGSLDSLVTKVTKSKEIKEFIKATKDSREMRANKAKLTQTKKAKIKSDKFLDAQDKREILMLVEGDSALGGLVPALGRKNIAYYALKGKPLNAWSCTPQKLTQNKELSELLSIVHNSSFEKIVFGTDQDLDGFHIRGLLLGFVYKYLPEYLDKVYFLQTPVKGVLKNDELIRWSFSIAEDLKIKSGEVSHYFKGLGSWSAPELSMVIAKEGFDKLLDKISINQNNPDDLKILEAWLGDNSQSRKDFILENDFNIAKV